MRTKRIRQRCHSLDISDHPGYLRRIQPQAIDEGRGHPGSFRIRNTGTGRLSISGLDVPDGFDIVTPPPATIEPGASADFSIQLRASATSVGVKQGTVQFSTNDATKPVFDFAIGGELLAELVPEISVADVSVKEGDAGTTNAAFVVSLSSSPTVSSPVSVT